MQNPDFVGDHDEEESEDFENLRRSTFTAPRGLFGGAPIFGEEPPFDDSDMNLHLSDSESDVDMTDDTQGANNKG